MCRITGWDELAVLGGSGTMSCRITGWDELAVLGGSGTMSCFSSRRRTLEQALDVMHCDLVMLVCASALSSSFTLEALLVSHISKR